ncbi:MAG TPA: GYD domain-containing protein [Chthoniobacterales bacterium]
MATYFMFGKYSLDAVKAISAKRTQDAVATIQEHGGELKSAYALLGDVDLALIVDLPDTGQAMKASAALSKLLGISFSTAPAVSMDEFDKLLG